MTSTPPGVSATPQSALNVVRQASGVSAGSAARVSLALNGATLGPDNADAELAAFGQTTLGAADSVDGLTQTIVANSAAIQQLQNQDAANSNNGVNFFLNFGDSDVSLAGFTETITPAGHGTLGIVGGYAALTQTVAGPFTGLALYNSTPTNTDYQIVSAIYATKPAGSATNILIGRSNAAGTTRVYAAINGSGTAYLYNVVSGTATLMATDSYFPFYTGAAYSLVCGIEGSTNTYQVLANGAPILEWVDTSGISNIGANYRYCGFGLAQSGGAPSNVAAFGFVDDAPGPLIGDIFRAYRTSSTVLELSSSALAAVAPASFYDTVALQSSNYSYTASTNSLQVSISGIYVVKVSVQWAPSPGSPPTWAYFGAELFKNGEAIEGGSAFFVNSPGVWPYFVPIASMFTVQLDAGDIIQPALFSNSSPSGDSNGVIGDSTGVCAIFSCALINTGISASSG